MFLSSLLALSLDLESTKASVRTWPYPPEMCWALRLITLYSTHLPWITETISTTTGTLRSCRPSSGLPVLKWERASISTRPRPRRRPTFSGVPRSDGVVKSLIYRVVAIFQTLDIPHVCLRAWKITTPCISKFLLSHPTTFYETIKVWPALFREGLINSDLPRYMDVSPFSVAISRCKCSLAVYSPSPLILNPPRHLFELDRIHRYGTSSKNRW